MWYMKHANGRMGEDDQQLSIPTANMCNEERPSTYFCTLAPSAADVNRAHVS